MTGGEVAAAAAIVEAAKHAGEQIAEEHKSVNNELLSGAKDSRYMADASDNYAKRIAIRQAILTKMYLPIAKLFGVANDYFQNDFEKDMAEKLADVPDEHLVAPKASLAAPAMQQLGFSLDEPDLKEMYLNLLATASDGRKKETAHPSFVEIVKQLSANEIRFLESVLKLNLGNSIPMVRFKLVEEGREGWNLIQSHVVPVTPDSAEAIKTSTSATYIENWVRLGLVTVNYDEFLMAPDAYEWVELSGQMTGIKKAIADMPGKSVTFDKGTLSPTNFGKAFANVVGIRERTSP